MSDSDVVLADPNAISRLGLYIGIPPQEMRTIQSEITRQVGDLFRIPYRRICDTNDLLEWICKYNRGDRRTEVPELRLEQLLQGATCHTSIFGYWMGGSAREQRMDDHTEILDFVIPPSAFGPTFLLILSELVFPTLLLGRQEAILALVSLPATRLPRQPSEVSPDGAESSTAPDHQRLVFGDQELLRSQRQVHVRTWPTDQAIATLELPPLKTLRLLAKCVELLAPVGKDRTIPQPVSTPDQPTWEGDVIVSLANWLDETFGNKFSVAGPWFRNTAPFRERAHLEIGQPEHNKTRESIPIPIVPVRLMVNTLTWWTLWGHANCVRISADTAMGSSDFAGVEKLSFLAESLVADTATGRRVEQESAVWDHQSSPWSPFAAVRLILAADYLLDWIREDWLRTKGAEFRYLEVDGPSMSAGVTDFMDEPNWESKKIGETGYQKFFRITEESRDPLLNAVLWLAFVRDMALETASLIWKLSGRLEKATKSQVSIGWEKPFTRDRFFQFAAIVLSSERKKVLNKPQRYKKHDFAIPRRSIAAALNVLEGVHDYGFPDNYLLNAWNMFSRMSGCRDEDVPNSGEWINRANDSRMFPKTIVKQLGSSRTTWWVETDRIWRRTHPVAKYWLAPLMLELAWNAVKHEWATGRGVDKVERRSKLLLDSLTESTLSSFALLKRRKPPGWKLPEFLGEIMEETSWALPLGHVPTPIQEIEREEYEGPSPGSTRGTSPLLDQARQLLAGDDQNKRKTPPWKNIDRVVKLLDDSQIIHFVVRN